MSDVSDQDSLLKIITASALLLTLVVVVLGAYTRLVDAGLGCPDWPGCYGFVVVPNSSDDIQEAESRYPSAPFESHKAWPEMIHRYAASTLGLLLVALPLVAWRRKYSLTLPISLALLVILQGAFGAWTVTLKLWPQVVTAHLLGGFATLSLLWVYAMKIGLIPRWSIKDNIRRHAAWAIGLLVLQIALGGWTSSNYAALACPDFPLCHGSLTPDMNLRDGFNILQDVGPNYLGGTMTNDARIAIQVTHRLGALVAFFVIGSLILRLKGLTHGVVAGLLVVQIALGIFNVILNLPLINATAHNLFAALLLLALITVWQGTESSGSDLLNKNDR